MGKISKFEIKLDKPSEVYSEGQTVEGSVEVELTDTMKMRGIKLEFSGGASVHWTETHSTGSGKDRRTETRHYSSSETYFNFEYILFGPASGSTTLPAGNHTYPFSYTLPPNLPSSYESDIGHVRYQLKARIDKPWKFDHKTKKLFTVVSMLDLNQQPSAPLPVYRESSKYLCCLCCKSGPISAKCHLNHSGYVPGDTIYINAEIINNSSRRICSSSVKLFMNTIYHATSKSKISVNCIAECSRSDIKPYDRDNWTNVELIVPAVPPSFLAGCRIIDIRYVLQLEVDPAGPAFELIVPLDIIIGTIPLHHVVQGLYSQTNQVTKQAQQEPSSPSSAPPMKLPPPTYSECVFGKLPVDEEGEELTRGDKHFAPNYTYYNWSKS
ncbi:hypothetical protein ACF0H5_013475 [Mactra antiquata]